MSWPKRSDYVEKTNLNGDFYFMPIKFKLRSYYGQAYLDSIGITETGEKALVRINGIKIFVDVELCEKSLIATEKYSCVKKIMLPGRYLSKPRTYLRVFFKSSTERNNFIEEYRLQFFIGNDDKLIYLILRESNINTAGWNIIKNFRKISKHSSEKLPVQVSVNVGDVVGVETPERLIKDKSIICAWDLETYTPNNFGGVPSPGDRNDTIKMCAMVFRYYWSKKQLCSIIISSIKVKVPGALVIITKNIVEAFKRVLEKMQPDFITGFNDGGYDWPFIKNRVSDMDGFTNALCCIEYEGYEKSMVGPMKNGNKFNKPKIIKVEANTQPAVYDAFTFDGCISFDTAIIMRRLNKNETKFGNLNSFLSKYGIAPKEDMKYDIMAKIFHLWELTTPEEIAKMDSQCIPFPNDTKAGSIAICQLTASDILSLFEMSDKVAIYCLRDAAACLDLILKVNTIPDSREFVNKARCPTEDAFYKADGIKVRNCILDAARKPEWGCWPEKYSLVFSTYKPYNEKTTTKKDETKTFPGGYVRFPDKGVYSRVGTRPCSGLDAESLYPSIIRAFNISPEYLTMEPENFKEFNFTEISTHYKLKKDPKSSATVIRGYFLKSQNNNLGSGNWTYGNFGIVPTLLNRFFMHRKELKKSLFKWEIIREKITKDAKNAKNIEEVIKILGERIIEIKNTAESYIGKKKELELNKIGSYELAIKFINEENVDLEELNDRSLFKFNYFNSKQLTVKVFMNTFYGEMGNVDSPFFIPEMGGAVTKMGRTCIKEIGTLVQSKGYRIYYGDTDSLYISAPEAVFEDADRKFNEGIVNKELYYEEMVGITMSKMQEISEESNDYFLKKYNCPFLRMAYEEVLYPFGFFGKKNYFGVKHINSIDFTLCRTTDRVKFEKEIFSRGMPLRRRDASKFVKAVLVEILLYFCALEEKRDYGTIVDDVIKGFIEKTTREPETFRELVLKSYSFREPGENTRTSQMKFRSKMIKLYLEEQVNRAINMVRNGDESGYAILKKILDDDGYFLEQSVRMPRIDIENYVIDKDLLNLNFYVPNYGERHELVMARLPQILKSNGRKDKMPKGELLEFVNMIGNEHYANYIKTKYKERGFNLPKFSRVDIAFEHYFETLYGTLGRYVLFLYWKDEIESGLKGADLKNAIKKAEAKKITEIRKVMKLKYNNYWEKIEYNTTDVICKFKNAEKSYREIAGYGFVANEIFNYFMTPSYDHATIKKGLTKVLNTQEIVTINVEAIFGKINQNRTVALANLDNDVNKLYDDIKDICVDIDRYAIHIKKIDEQFARLKARKQLEIIFEMWKRKRNVKSGIYVSISNNILSAFF